MSLNDTTFAEGDSSGLTIFNYHLVNCCLGSYFDAVEQPAVAEVYI